MPPGSLADPSVGAGVVLYRGLQEAVWAEVVGAVVEAAEEMLRSGDAAADAAEGVAVPAQVAAAIGNPGDVVPGADGQQQDLI